MRIDIDEALTATGIAGRVRSGLSSAHDVLDGCFARIDAQDAQIGAFQVVDRDGARRAADELSRRPDLDRLPLAGVPVAVKDNIAVAGLPTRYGSAATSAAPAIGDDELVRRLREAGAIVVGKTRMPELAIWGFTESLAHGGTRNPRDLSRNAGGSTGGGAAAVAAGMVPLALGSDGGGSLRIPAANCGVVGLKPAADVVPLAGGIGDHWFGCTAFGPIAMSVADAVLAVDVLSGGPEWRSAPVASAETVRIAGSWRSPSPIGPAGVGERQAVRDAMALAAAAGHRVRAGDPPYPRTLINAWVRHWFAGVAVEAEALGLSGEATAPPGTAAAQAREALEPRTRAVLDRGNRLRRRGKPDLSAARAWRDRALTWFSDVEVLMTPVIARPAPAAGWGTRAGFGRSYLNGARGIPFTQAWNLAGFTAMSVPVGGRGAVQLICAPGREAALLRVAAALEQPACPSPS